MKNHKRRAFRDPAHPKYNLYLDHRIRMDDRRRKQLAQRATVRRYHVAGDLPRYLWKQDVTNPVMATAMEVKNIFSRNAKTTIQRAQ